MNNENPTNPNETNELGATALGSAPVSEPNPSVAPVSEPVNNGMPTPPVMPENTNPINPAPADAILEPQASASTESVNLGAPVVPTEPAPAAPETPVTPENSVAPAAPSSVVTPVTEPANNANADMGPIEQPIPGTNGSYNATSNVNSNGFVEPTKVADVGAVPPAQKEPKAKKPMNKVLFIILIVVLLAAIAYGVYYYLSLGKNKTTLTVKTNPVTLNLGDALSSDINDYAQITGTNPKNCVLHTENVDVTKAGNYEFTVVCNEQTYKGAISIVDNAPVTVSPRFVYTGISANATNPEETPTSINYKPEDFIDEETCSASECSYTFSSEVSFAELTKQAGKYEIKIKVEADGKSADVSSYLVVFEKPLKLFLSCNATDEENNSTIVDKFAIGDDNTYINYGERQHIYYFTNEDDYKTAVADKPATISYDGNTGTAIYNDTEKSLTIVEELSNDKLNGEAEGTFPNTYMAISQLYGTKNYTCKAER